MIIIGRKLIMAKLVIGNVKFDYQVSEFDMSHLMDCFFFFNDTATTDIYTNLHTLSLHDALPIWLPDSYPTAPGPVTAIFAGLLTKVGVYARSEEHTSELQSHSEISYAVFCL